MKNKKDLHCPCGRIAECNDSRGQRPAHRSVQSVTDDVRELCEKDKQKYPFRERAEKVRYGLEDQNGDHHVRCRQD